MNRIVILAAGKGTRMNVDIPKVLVPINGKPMIVHLLESVVNSEIDRNPVIVVSPDNIAMIKGTLKNFDCHFAIQDRQLGTGHALHCAEPILDTAENVLVFYGDHPLIKKETIINLINSHKESGCNLTIMTVFLEDFKDWRIVFERWGRILRNQDEITGIVEYKDATDEQRKITEINPGLYCFNKNWLYENIDKLQNINAQREYYLTDMLKIAKQKGISINNISVNPLETIGINTIEEKKIASKLMK